VRENRVGHAEAAVNSPKGENAYAALRAWQFTTPQPSIAVGISAEIRRAASANIVFCTGVGRR
jgi:hypothetical protein